MEIPFPIAAQQALTQQAVALAMVKQAAAMEQMLVNMIAESVGVPVSSARGSAVNFTA